jgi:fatty-acyl-CoA synthase
MGLILSEISGAKIVAFESFDPGEILRGIETHKITTFAGTPAMYYMILNHKDFDTNKVTSLRVGNYGGAPMTPDNIRELMSKLGMTFFSMYGMTETTGLVTVTEKGAEPEIVATTIGKNFNEGCEIKIVDPKNRKALPFGRVGEIVTRGWHVTEGYYNEPELYAKTRDEKGWLYTGDLGMMDRQGNLKFAGRIKELIISGGMNIDPMEIEHFLLRHPAVESAHIVGLPDQRMGELVGDFIKLRKNASCTADEIRSFCEGKIGKYKIPKYIKFIDEAPRNAVGKVQKFKIREMGIKEFHLEA